MKYDSLTSGYDTETKARHLQNISAGTNDCSLWRE